jgi:putative membrane protein
LLASVFLVAGWALPGLAQGIEGREFHGHYGWGYGHMFFGGLMVILFWAGIIVLVVLAVRWFGGGDRTGLERPSGRQSALEILQERYARGEIDHDEFERRKQLLTE